jgi:hypothetical protein
LASRSRYPVETFPNLLAPAAKPKPHISELNDVLLFWWNALDLVDCLDILLDVLLVIHDADAPIHLPGNAIAPATPQKKICRWRDHKRGI